jgi:hypothetical protein
VVFSCDSSCDLTICVAGKNYSPNSRSEKTTEQQIGYNKNLDSDLEYKMSCSVRKFILEKLNLSENSLLTITPNTIFNASTVGLVDRGAAGEEQSQRWLIIEK